MSDLREELLTCVVNRMILEEIDTVVINQVKEILVISLDNYELTDRCTDVAVYDDSAEQILRIWVGMLLTKGRSRKTVKNYYDTVRRFEKEIKIPLMSIGKFDILTWLAKKQTEVSMITCDNYRSALRSFYDWAYRERVIATNPMEGIDPIKFDYVLRKPFSDCEIDAIRYNCKTKRDRAIVELLLSSGVRIDELHSMNIDDIDFNTLEVLVRSGKGGKQRITYMNLVAATHLKAYLVTRKDNDPCLFYSRNHNRMSKTAINRSLKEIGKTCGVDNIHAHRFRHTFAHNAIRKGMDIRTLQMLLGHEDLNTTTKYINFNNQHIKMQHQLCCC